MKVNIKNTASILMALYFLVSYKIVFINSNFLMGGGLFTLALSCIGLSMLNSKFETVREKYIYIIFFFTLFHYFFFLFPLNNFDRFSPLSFFTFFLVCYFYLYPTVLRRSFSLIEKIVYYIAIGSLISFVLYALNIPFFIEYKIFGQDNNLTYNFYYFSFYISNQIIPLGITNIYRNSAIFSEPGHFGLLLSFILLYRNNSNNQKINIVFFTTLITTFSAASAIGIILYVIKLLFLSNIKPHRKFLFLLVFCFLIIISFAFIESIILSKFSSINLINILNERSVNPVSLSYINNSGSAFFGLGRDAAEILNFQSSDIRIYILKYGYFSIITLSIPFLMLIFLVIKDLDNIRFIIISLLIIIALHRAWMIDKPYFAYMLLLAIVMKKDDKY